MKILSRTRPFRISFTLLNNVFGLSKGMKFYSYRGKSKIYTIDHNFIFTIKKHFEEKNLGFVLFLKNFFKFRKELCDKSYNDKGLGDNIIKYHLDNDFDIDSTSSTRISFHFSRLRNTEAHLTFLEKTRQAILIQKNLRMFLMKMNMYRRIDEELKQRALMCIIQIQKHVRRMQAERRIREYAIMMNILTSRKDSWVYVEKFMERIYQRNIVRKQELFGNIIALRYEAAVTIQKNLRMLLTQKEVKRIQHLEKEYFSITYPFVAKSVKLKVFVYTSGSLKDDEFKVVEKLFTFKYCRFRHTFVLYIEQNEFQPGKYRCQLIVDNLITCDGRFPHIEFSDGHFYNLIDFKMRNPQMVCEAKNDNKSLSETSSFTDKSYFSTLKKLHTEEPYLELKQNLLSKEAFSFMDRLRDSSVTDYINFD